MNDALLYAPSTRVVIRDEEWLIKKSDPSADGGYLLSCDGVSELVQGLSAQFLTKLEEKITVLDPAKTKLVLDRSSHFNNTFLYLEAHLRRSTPNDQKIHLAHRAAMNLVPYQLDPALQALRQPRQRILMADAVGLGKTLEAGILTTELIQRGRGQRILVIAVKSMLTQFQKEFWNRFSIPLIRLDSVGLQRVRNSIPSNHNPFNYYDRTIISIDTLKNKLEYRNYLEHAWWDIIIIDECHNVAARENEGGISQRARLAKMLAGRSDTMILLSSTPHDGSARSFASLMSLLDPTAISDPDDYAPQDFREKGLVIRRFKKDIQSQVNADFQERTTEEVRQITTAQEEAAFNMLLAIPFTQKGVHRNGKQQELQRVAMQKAIFSSPCAALKSTYKRIELLKTKPALSQDEEAEIQALRKFANCLESINPDSFSKFQALVRYLKSPDFNWNPADPTDRLVIFSERIETLCWLNKELPKALEMQPIQFGILHGQMADTDQEKLVEQFGQEKDLMRVLLCSDVASEGLNLHYCCHRLVHFDLPWSLMVFQQRNGRIDRYGQNKRPRIVYLFVETKVERIKGDMRILEILQKKDEQTQKNLGDPRIFDPDKEAEHIANKMAERTSPEAFEAEINAAETSTTNQANSAGAENGDWLLRLFTKTPSHEGTPTASISSLDAIDEGFSLFGITEDGAAEYAFAKTALEELSKSIPIAQFSYSDDVDQMITLTAPKDLKDRLKVLLPIEVHDSEHRYTLCAKRSCITAASEEARQVSAKQDSWPKLHYLWPQHPIMEWLSDRVLTAFGQHCAPVIQYPQLIGGEQAFLLMGLIPNRKGQPLLMEWQVVLWSSKQLILEPFFAFVKRNKFQAGCLANRNLTIETSSLQKNLPYAVEAMREHMLKQQEILAFDMTNRLRKVLSDLENLKKQQQEQLERRLSQSQQVETLKRTRREKRTQDINKVFEEYKWWVQDTMTTEQQPFIQVLAVAVR